MKPGPLAELTAQTDGARRTRCGARAGFGAEARTKPLSETTAPFRAAEGSRHPARRSRRSHAAAWVPVLALDVAVVAGCLVAANALVRRPHGTPAPLAGAGGWLLVLALPAVTAFAFACGGLYPTWPRRLLTNSFSEVRDLAYCLAVATVVVLGAAVAVGGTTGRSGVVLSVVVVGALLAFPALVVARALVHALLRAVGIERFRVLIVGSGEVADHLGQYLSWDPRVELVGRVDDGPGRGSDVLGTLRDLPRLCETEAVDQVVVGFSHTHPSRLVSILQQLEPTVAVSVVPRFYDLLTWRSTSNDLNGLALLELAPATSFAGARATKRAFDLALASLFLVVLSPLLAAVALAVKVTSKGPVLFRQERVGRGGAPFVMWKYRTMVERVDAPGAAAAGVRHGGLGKVEDDPRTTRLGAFLRRTSLDELPQLVNVVRGDMSLVGPRPFVAEDTARFRGAPERRFEMRPGMTGLWQVSGRSDLSFDDLARLDYLYVAAWSIPWDLRILWATPRQVLNGHGAF